MSDIDYIIDAARDSAGNDDELDGLIWVAAQSYLSLRGGIGDLGPADYSGSIDAIKVLAEKCLPGWGWRVGTCSVSDDAWLFPDTNHPILGAGLAKKYAHLHDPVEWFLEKTDVDLRPQGRQALAMCISLLLALKYADGMA